MARAPSEALCSGPAAASSVDPVVSRRLTCSIIRSVEGFGELRSAWQRLARHPTVDPDFCRLLAQTRPEILRPHVVAVHEGSELVALLAGRVENVTVGLRIGYKNLYRVRTRCLTMPYGGVMGDDHPEVLKCLSDHLVDLLRGREVDMVDFDNVRNDSALHAVVRDSAPLPCRSHFAESHIHWKMVLPASGVEIEKAMSKKHRYWVRRMRKRFQEKFPDKIEFACRKEILGPVGLADELESIAKHTYQRGLGAGFVNDEEHRRRLELWSNRGLLRAYVLRAAGKPVAFCLGTRFHDTFFLSDMGFLPEWGEFEPGTLIFLHMLDCLCAEGLKFLDFGLGDAFYKQRFGTEHWQESMLCVFAPSFKGIALNLTDTGSRVIRLAGRKLLNRMDALKKLKKKWRQKLASRSASAPADKIETEP